MTTYPNSSYLVDIVNSILIQPCNFFIAGGSVAGIEDYNNYKFKDIDVYFESQNDLINFINLINNPLFESPVRAINHFQYYTQICTDYNIIQIINMKFGTPNEILESFDLNKTQIGITNNYDLISKNRDGDLKVNKLENSSVYRYIKYVNKGYKFNMEEFMKIICRKRGLGGYIDYNFIENIGGEISTAFEYIFDNYNDNFNNVLDYTFKNIIKEKNAFEIINSILSFYNYVNIPKFILEKYPIIIASLIKSSYYYKFNNPDMVKIAINNVPEYLI